MTSSPGDGAAASVSRSRAGRDIIVNLYSDVPATLRSHLREREFAPLIEARLDGFVGRGFVVDQIDRHLMDPAFPSGYVIVRGEPGIGKTALAAHLVMERGWVHHFNLASANIRSSEAFLGNVCAQLITRYGLDIDRLPDQALRDSGFLLRVLDDAMRAATSPLVVVVDALDEAEAPLPESGANRLLLPVVLPTGVYVLVTGREQHDDGLYVDSDRLITIEDDDPRNLADLTEFANGFMIRHATALDGVLSSWQVPRHGAVQRLVDASEGNFQYLRLVLTELVSGTRLLSEEDLPRGLMRYYQRHWARMRSRSDSEYEGRQRPVLCYLAAAREPVGVEEIATWTGLSSGAVRAVLRQWRQFLNHSDGGRYSIYHRSFADFLDREEGLAFYHAQIADSALAKVWGTDR